MNYEEPVLSVPKVINWLYTCACNLNCDFCYRIRGERDLSLSEKYKIVDKIANASVPKLTVTGGEPLLGEGIYDIIHYARGRGIFVSLHTNGILLDKDGLDKLEGNVGRVSLPLDSSTNEMNYVMRGYDGYLDLIIGLMDELKERKIPMSLKTVATRKNINDIPNIAKLIRKYPLDVWLISEFTPVGEAKKNKEEFELDENELSKLQLSNLPFKVAIRSSNQDYSIPFLFLGPGRNVWTTSKRKRDYRFIGNFFEEEIFGLWRKICQTNPVNKNYLENTWTEKK